MSTHYQEREWLDSKPKPTPWVAGGDWPRPFFTKGQAMSKWEQPIDRANEEIERLKARAEAAEARSVEIENQRHLAAVAVEAAEKRAEAAEAERDKLRAALERRGEIIFGKEGD